MINASLSAKLSLESQWVRKGSITTYSDEHLKDTTTSVDQNADNGITKVKDMVNINSKFQESWSSHIKGLVVQGRFLELLQIK